MLLAQARPSSRGEFFNSLQKFCIPAVGYQLAIADIDYDRG
jgi:hypothetical protein